MQAKDYYKEEWSQVFSLSTESPSGVVWKKPMKKHLIGKPAGYLCDLGYWVVEYKGKAIKVHRIVYFLNVGHLDSNLIIDHINRCRSDNSFSNLRLVDVETNAKNSSIMKNNKTGITGVSVSARERQTYITATYTPPNGKNMSKYFSVDKLGYEEAFRLACEWRKTKIAELNEQGAGYTERHGT